jgi:NAD(P)-dependent dehydrogenase (short-subunit alcohol dehydrogenase family)
MYSYAGKTVLITGASSGIGGAFAQHYSCTCVEAEGDDPMGKLNKLERAHVRLKFRRRLL